MRKKLAAFFRPNIVTIIVFLALVLIIPVVYIYAEPERTNYRPNEQQHWDIKAKQYDGLLDEVIFHTEGSLDDLLGIFHRDYVSNFIGIPLLVLYYLIAAGIIYIINRILPEIPAPQTT